MQVIPLDPSTSPVNTGKYRHGDSNPGTNPASGLRNCVLMHPTELLTRRVRLPVVRLPHEWHEDQRRPSCVGRPSPSKGRKYKKTPPTLEEAYRIIEALKTRTPEKWRNRWGNTDIRNGALAAFLLGTGVRIHEALLCTPRDVDHTHKTVHVLRGKGGKERFSMISPYALKELRAWLEIRAELGYTVDQPIFCTLEGPTKGGMLDQSYFRDCLHAAGKAAGVDKRVVCHQWRHAHALHLYRSGVGLMAISRQLGHSNVQTTSIYLEGLGALEFAEDVLSAWDDADPDVLESAAHELRDALPASRQLEQAMARIRDLEAQLAVAA